MDIKDVVNVNPERMSGAPCFTGTRVPINHLFDYLEAGDSLDVFLEDFPTVTRDQALGVLERSRTRVAAVKEKNITVIQTILAAWIALYRTLKTHRHCYWTLSGLADLISAVIAG